MTGPATLGASTGPVSLWQNLDFRRLWIGETVSQFGSAISGVALPLVALLVLDASTLQVGLLATFQSVAFLLIGLPSGAWIDRMRLRAVLITNNLIRLVALVSIPLAQATGTLSIGQALRRRLGDECQHRLLRRGLPVLPAWWWTARPWWRATPAFRQASRSPRWPPLPSAAD